MGQIIFVTGGASSGKSKFAESLAEGRTAYVATAEALDDEMREKVRRHKARRPADWLTIEEPRDLSLAMRMLPDAVACLLVDSLTLWVANLLDLTDERVIELARRFVADTRRLRAKAIVVSDEVGMGIVPGDRASRRYRRLLGEVNQIVASEADRVYLVVSGLPIEVKR